jgi:hypothetical protein
MVSTRSKREQKVLLAIANDWRPNKLITNYSITNKDPPNMNKKTPNKKSEQDLLCEIADEVKSLVLSVVFILIAALILFSILWPALEFFNVF